MLLHPVVRDLVLVALAASVGWGLRGAGTSVLAQRSGSSSGELGFQLSGIGGDTSLTVYNPNNRTLYVYPRIAQGNAHINCEFSLTVASPGGPIERQNCGVGSQVP
jgi:hypothetical protein